MGCGSSLLQTALLKEHPTRSSRRSELMSRWGHGMCSALKWLPARCWMRSRTPPGVQMLSCWRNRGCWRHCLLSDCARHSHGGKQKRHPVGTTLQAANKAGQRKRTGLNDINAYGQSSEQLFRRRKDEVRHAGEHEGTPSGQPFGRLTKRGKHKQTEISEHQTPWPAVRTTLLASERHKPVGLSRCGQDSRGLSSAPPAAPRRASDAPARLQTERCARVQRAATWRGRNARASGRPRAKSPRRAPRAIQPCTPPQGRTSCRGPRWCVWTHPPAPGRARDASAALPFPAAGAVASGESTPDAAPVASEKQNE